MFESHGKCTAHPGNIPCAAEAFLPPPPDHLLTVQKKRPPPRLLLGGKAAILEKTRRRNTRHSCTCSGKESKALFISRVFEGMREDYFVSWNFRDRLFTSPGFEGIITGYPYKSPPL
jgi:hypothetical protein